MPSRNGPPVNKSCSRVLRDTVAERPVFLCDLHETNEHVLAADAAFFAQVIFRAIENGEHFIGGRPNAHPHIFVHGMIRAGRGIDVKQTLMSEAADKVRAVAGVGAEDVWFYIQDIDAPQMIEFGRFLPEPGAEDAWRKAIAPEKQAQLGRAGVKVL